MGNLCSAFQGAGEGQSVLVLAIFKVTLIQNNQYARVAHFRAVCPKLPQYSDYPFVIGLLHLA